MRTVTSRNQVQRMGQNVRFLREYARRIIVEGDSKLGILDDVRQEHMEGVWEASRSCGLTERDVVLLVCNGILSQCT